MKSFSNAEILDIPVGWGGYTVFHGFSGGHPLQFSIVDIGIYLTLVASWPAVMI